MAGKVINNNKVIYIIIMRLDSFHRQLPMEAEGGRNVVLECGKNRLTFHLPSIGGHMASGEADPEARRSRVVLSLTRLSG
jgi:hypothetical protein